MSSETGGLSAPSYQELEECLRLVAQSLEWYAHGSCRGFHNRGPLKTGEATRLAKSTLDRIGAPESGSSNQDMNGKYRHWEEVLAWHEGYAACEKSITAKRENTMPTRVTFPQVPGEWVRAEKYDKVIDQRDQLREALWEVVNDCSMSMSSGVEEMARAALKATEE